MPAAHSRRFRDGKTFAGELSAAMHRVGALGVPYPDGYCDELIAKYEKDGVPYPHILSILGEPRIKGHFFYARMPGRTGPFLDYGCGTGDNIRQLLRDGFPRIQITGFDLTWESINLGFDLYRDEDRIRDLFVVNDTFPFGKETFDTIYSGSVIHVIADDDELCGYLDNAWAALRPGGILFGSTLGIDDGDTCAPDEQGPPRVIPRAELTRHLTAAGFLSPSLVKQPHEAHTPDDKKCVFEFCTRKSG
jgi:SAM-dependent methyltransferase